MDDTSGQFIEKLIELSEIDGKIEEFRQREEELVSNIEMLRQGVIRLQSEARRLKEEIDRKERDLDLFEKEVQYENKKLIDRRRAISNIPDAKAQIAAQKEIEAFASQQALREEKLLQDMQSLEELKGNLAEMEENLTKKADELEKSEAEFSEELNSIEKSIEQLEKERGHLVSSLDKAIVRKYEMIKGKYPTDSVVPIVDKHCKGCYMTLAAQVIVSVARGAELVQCPGCARILYLEDTLKSKD